MKARLAMLCVAVSLGACSHNFAPVVYHHSGRLTSDEPQFAQGAPAQAGDPAMTVAPAAHVDRQSLDATSTSLAPPVESAPSPSATGETVLRSYPTTQPSFAHESIVIVAPGDTVFSLGRKYGVSSQSIIGANHIAPPYGLRLGDRLVIPAAHEVQTQGDTSVLVRPGDTLYSLSRARGLDARSLASANGIAPPYALKTGMRLNLPEGASSRAYAARAGSGAGEGGPLLKLGQYPPPPASAPTPVDPPPVNIVTARASAQGFVWPVSGRIISDFGLQSAGRRNDGIDIAVAEGTPVRAARGGEVIYTGNEIRGYGNLVLVKHEDGYVSAYAHNSRIVVKRGDIVRQGQHIADSGSSGNVTGPQVHFEIRKDRKPVNPQGYLPRA
jgi:murein DD-endopeptidase MepM/ murein hydrolase activator NlpD